MRDRYNTWDECKKQVNGFSGAEYKSFSTFQEAKEYIDGSDLTHQYIL
ncbi:viroplasmin family protein [Clostridioides difficile]